jgi:hypothetical protein
MRAKYPMQERKIDGRKEWVRSDELEPIQAADILYECSSTAGSTSTTACTSPN